MVLELVLELEPEPFFVRDGLVVVDEDEGEVEVELELEELGGAGDVVVVLVTEGTEIVELELETGWQDSLSDATGPVIGRFICEIGVPGGTSTLKTNVWPATVVTVTVHAWAEAEGMSANAIVMSAALARTSTPINLRRMFTAALLLRPS